jgi:hypothetical protein
MEDHPRQAGGSLLEVRRETATMTRRSRQGLKGALVAASAVATASATEDSA